MTPKHLYEYDFGVRLIYHINELFVNNYDAYNDNTINHTRGYRKALCDIKEIIETEIKGGNNNDSRTE